MPGHSNPNLQTKFKAQPLSYSCQALDQQQEVQRILWTSTDQSTNQRHQQTEDTTRILEFYNILLLCLVYHIPSAYPVKLTAEWPWVYTLPLFQSLRALIFRVHRSHRRHGLGPWGWVTTSQGSSMSFCPGLVYFITVQGMCMNVYIPM